jgi:hypothetical protein
VGLWIQNVGVRADHLPVSLAARAARESFGLPEPMEGWTWTSLAGWDEGADGLELQELDALAAAAAAEAGAPVLAFSVHDSDSVYVVGAQPGGAAFRLVVNEDHWDADTPPPQELYEAVAWAREHALRAPSVAELQEMLARRYVFAEEGLSVVLARMGLLPPEAEHEVEEEDEEDREERARPASLEDVGDLAPGRDDRSLDGERWYTTVTGFRGREDERWTVVFAEVPLPMRVMGIDLPEGLAETLTRAVEATGMGQALAWLCRRGDRMRMLDPVFDSRDELTRELAGPYSNLEVGEWRRVPEDVERKLSATIDWAEEQAGS